MFNQCDYRMAKAQQERLLVQAEKQDGRARRPNRFVALMRRLTEKDRGRVTAKLGRMPAQAEL